MKLAIYDFDGTLFPDETVPFLIKQYSRLGYSRGKQAKVFARMMLLFTKYKMKIGQTMTKEVFRHQATQITLSLFETMTEDEVNVFFKKLSDEVFKALDPDVVRTLKKRQSEGYRTLLLSGGFLPLIQPIGNQLGFDHIIGSNLNYKTDNSGRKIIQPYEPIHIVTGQNKDLALEEHYGQVEVDWNGSFAYADSVYDQGVLKRVGNPVGVNPDSGLADICASNGWTVIRTESGSKLDKRTISSK